MEGRRVPPPPPPRMNPNIQNGEGEVKVERQVSEQDHVQPAQAPLQTVTAQSESQPVQKKKFVLSDKAKTALLSIGAIIFLLGGVACFIMLFL